jgi:hypothetical protein
VSGALRDSLDEAYSGAGRLYGMFERTLIDISLMRFAFRSWLPSAMPSFGVTARGSWAEQHSPGSLGECCLFPCPDSLQVILGSRHFGGAAWGGQG